MQSTTSLTWEGENRSSNCLNCRLQQRTSWVSTHGIPRGIHEYAWLRPIMYSLHLQCEGLCVFVRQAPVTSSQTSPPAPRGAKTTDAERRHFKEPTWPAEKPLLFLPVLSIWPMWPSLQRIGRSAKKRRRRKNRRRRNANNAATMATFGA